MPSWRSRSIATVFKLGGKEVVAYSAAGNALAGSAHGDNLWLFGLDGTLDPVTASGSAMQFTQGAAGEPNLTNGKTTYDRACSSCHGPQGEGGHDGAPSLRAMRNAAVVMQTVSEGRREMPSFSSLLTAEQIRDVAGYVSQRLAQP
jgi:alcohol dehydrogenase (cytochrome c)